MTATHLVKNIGPSSTWISTVANHIDTLPKNERLQFAAMGFNDENGFPRKKFDLPPKTIVIPQIV
jgi:hypothetical protein